MNRKCLLKKGLAVLTSLSMSLGLCISGNAAVPLDTVTVSAEEDVEEGVALGEINGTEEPEPDSGIRQATISDALYDEDGDLLDGEVIDDVLTATDSNAEILEDSILLEGQLLQTEGTIASGTCGEHSGWEIIDEDGKAVLKINGSGAIEDYDSETEQPWAEFRSQIKNIIFGDDITSIGKNAFSKFSLEGNFVVPGHITNIGTSAFSGASFEKLILEEGIETIGQSAFASTSGTCSLVIPSTVKEISVGCFSDSHYSGRLELQDGIESIKGSAFAGCVFSGDLVIPASVTNTSYNIFKESTFSDGEIIIDANIDIIYPEAFRGIKGVTKVTFSETVREIWTQAFLDIRSCKEFYFRGDAPSYMVERGKMKTPYICEASFDSDAVLYYDSRRSGWDGAVFNYIKRPMPVFPERIELSPEEVQIGTGETKYLTVSVYPENAENKNMIWSSSDPEIVTVSKNGSICGVSLGSAYITATAEEKGTLTVPASASCLVTVNPVPVSGVSLNTASKDLEEGTVNSFLFAYIEPRGATNKRVTWSSSAPEVASVDSEGKVTALSVGTAVITVTTEDGGKTAECTVKVWPKVTGVVIDPSSCTLPVDDSIVLTAAVYPEDALNRSVSWVSYSPDIAEVDSAGKVTAKKEGTAYIWAMTSNYTFATCEVTVIPKTVPVENVILSNKSLELTKGESAQLTCTLKPSNATNKTVTYESGNTDVAEVDADGTVIAVSKGTAEITVTSEDGNHKDTCLVTVIEHHVTETVYWGINDSGQLKLSSLPLPSEYRGGSFKTKYAIYHAPWYSDRSLIEEVVVGGENDIVSPKDTSGWFSDLTFVTSMDLKGLDTSNVINMSQMFTDCEDLKALDLSGFNTENVQDMDLMFSGCKSLQSLNLSGFDTGSVTSMHYMFNECRSLSEINLSSFSTENVTDISSMFSGCASLEEIDLSGFRTDHVTDMAGLFYGCSRLKELKLGTFNTENVEDMRTMFARCSSLTSLDLSSFKTGKVTNFSQMFANCSELSSLNISSFDTDRAEKMSEMFYGCEKLTGIEVGGFSTRRVETFYGMFSGCSSLKALNVSGFDTKRSNNMASMFSGCSSLKTLDLSSFDTSRVNNMSGMFRDCSALESLNVNGFVTDGVTSTSSMFYGCRSLKRIYVSDDWNTENITSSSMMFTDCTALQGGAGTLYTSSKTDISYARIDKGSSAPGYFTSRKELTAKEEFVKRLYRTCLNREADAGGLNYWLGLLNSGSIKGIGLAGQFAFSQEFTKKNYCDEHFVKQLYVALMGREADSGGLSYWTGNLENGVTREAMVNSFTSSNEYKKLCNDAGIELGVQLKDTDFGAKKGIGTKPYGPCAVCGDETKVVQFAERMYTVCLGRAAETGGLAYWSKGLYEQTITGKSILESFFLSSEIKGKNLTNREYVRRIYKVMLDRNPDGSGWDYWEGQLNSGASPTAVIAGFIDSNEFTRICNEYGIKRK